MKKIVFVFAFVFVFAGLQRVFAQIDREFWFAAPSIVEEHDPVSINLVLVAYEEDAEIMIDQPAAGRTLLASRVVPAGSMFSFSIKGLTNYRSTVETAADGTVHPNGLHVRSTAPVTAYYTLADPNSEVYTFKGAHGLGQEFVVPTQFRHACGHNAYSSVEVVATENNTEVTFITFVPTNVAPSTTLVSPDTTTILLQKGETYAIRANQRNTPAAQHLGGTIVRSTKPIAVNTTDDSAAAGGDLDLIGEQLVPTTLAGNYYILPANNSANHEYATFFAAEDSATIYMVRLNAGVDTTYLDTTLLGTIHQGEHLDQRVNNFSACVFYSEDNAPFVAFHLTANENGNELSGTVLPSLNCSGSQSVCYAPTLSAGEAKVTILTHTENVGSFLVNGFPDGALSASSFEPVPGDSSWSYASCVNLQLYGNDASFRIENYDGVFHMGVLDNGGGACSYGFFSNYGQISLYGMSHKDLYYVGDTIRLHVTGAEAFSSITWIGPNGPLTPETSETLNPSEPSINGVTLADAGMYIVSAIHREGCEVAPDTFFVHVFPQVADRTKEICRGDSLHLQANAYGPYLWYNNGALIDGLSASTYAYLPEQTSTITVEESVSGVNMINWTDTLPQDFSQGWGNRTLYEQRFSHLILGANYLWQIDLLAPDSNLVAPKVQAFIDDQPVRIFAVANGAQPTRAYVPFTAFNSYAKLRLVCLSPRPETSLAVTAMSLTPTLAVAEHIQVNVTQPFTPHILAPDTICDDEQATLSLDVEGSRYVWSTGDTTATIQGGAGKYCVYVFQGACYEMACFTVNRCVPQDTLPILPPDTIIPEDPDTIVPEPIEPTCVDGIIYQRWNDVLSLKNAAHGGYDYASYSWYRNGEFLTSATSYITIPGGFQEGDTFYVVFTLPDGTELTTCDFTPQLMQQAPASSVEKVLQNGRLYIKLNDILYTPDGQRMSY